MTNIVSVEMIALLFFFLSILASSSSSSSSNSNKETIHIQPKIQVIVVIALLPAHAATAR